MRSYWRRKESPSSPHILSNRRSQAGPLAGPAFVFPQACVPRSPAPVSCSQMGEHTACFRSLAPQVAHLSFQKPPAFAAPGSLMADIGPAPGPSLPKAHKKGLWHHHRPFTVFRSLLQAIAQTPSPWRLPGSRLCKRHAAPAEKRPALPPGTGPSAVCSCCPGPPAGGCRRH